MRNQKIRKAGYADLANLTYVRNAFSYLNNYFLIYIEKNTNSHHQKMKMCRKVTYMTPRKNNQTGSLQDFTHFKSRIFTQIHMLVINYVTQKGDGGGSNRYYPRA